MFNFFKKTEGEPKNLKEIISQLQGLREDLGKFSKELESIKKESKFHIQRTGIVRYNPFSEVGGNQSFSIALLDGNSDGFVITGLYTREGNRVYAKPIDKGKSQYFLSKEEKEAVEKALSQKL